ncbi:zinc-dependent alcohol dehydrogenase [Achromobacter aloeverae]|uniref:Glutathione-dependent formaldehyde dehydrogenase n=1 Tax=Achromobacter aloeverae TaxID=1750518 RepID=A0A4Q1HHW7_9BURK|nr:zinc-dependent alcohol dehydrogenase [Achromobacter aloeverae]RXN86177.1 glutathione-dependent formaldehyde dehydrogenase [Achromobacter aloeverae]
MKAVVFHGIGDIRLDDVAEPTIAEDTDAIVRLTTSAICGTDLHFIRGTAESVEPGTILGHEGVGIVEQLGPQVRNLNVGDRVVIPSTIACGYCSYCRAGYYAQCDNANPNGKAAGTSFYGGPKQTGPFHGLQAEKARIPYAAVNLVKLPDEVDDEQAIMLSDIFPTGYFGADMAGIKPGHTVVVLGCGPVGQFAIASARLMHAGRIFAVDALPDRLGMARAQGAEAIDFEKEDPVQAVKKLTGDIGADCVIDAVGVDAQHAHHGPAHDPEAAQEQEKQSRQIAPHAHPHDGNWVPGDAPSQSLEWAVEMVAKAGTISIIGVYPPTAKTFPIGMAMNKNLTLRMGNCNHRKYVPMLVDLVRTGKVDPVAILTQREPLSSAIEAYEAFDKREPGWIKVALEPAE